MLLSSAYLPPVWYFTKLAMSDGQEVWIEQWDSYMKQTFRNRCVIGGADGPLVLTVPTEKTDKPKVLMRDVRISDHGEWRRQHWHALEAAYGQTPYFLYYEDDFRPFYEQRHAFLYDYNLQLMALCCELIDIHPHLRRTDAWAATADDDFRAVISPKNSPDRDSAFRPAPYWQVFADRFGFRANLSIVDMLFNMGPESIFVLKQSIVPTE